MERTTETTAAQALDTARRFLNRWRDRVTRRAADDLAQEAAIEAWRCRASLRQPDRWEAFVRTISRRCRYRALGGGLRLPMVSLDADRDLMEQLTDEERPAVRVSVAGRAMSLDWCLRELTGVLGVLGPLNQRIVRSFYEGFSCQELADRYQLSEHSVKVRLYRSRKRLRREFEVRAASAERGLGESLES